MLFVLKMLILVIYVMVPELLDLNQNVHVQKENLIIMESVNNVVIDVKLVKIIPKIV